MFFYICFFALVAVASSVPTTRIPQAVCDDSYHPINLTTAGWTLPLTSFADYQNCRYSFIVPKDYFAYVQLDAYQLRYMEQVVIMDNYGVGFQSDSQLHGINSFSNSQPWAVDFFISLKTKDGTGAQLAVNITLVPATPNANIVKSYVTYSNGGSVIIDAKDWNEGESYKFSSKSGKVYITVAYLDSASFDDIYKWNNVFIYEGGVFQRTLASTRVGRTQIAYTSSSSEVILYLAKKVDSIGAALITDYSNLYGVKHSAQYVPTVPGAFPYQITSVPGGEAAVALVSDRSNPINVTIQMLYSAQANGTYSYVGGGPIANHSNGVKLTDSQLPLVVTGYANTYYLSSGTGMIGFYRQ